MARSTCKIAYTRCNGTIALIAKNSEPSRTPDLDDLLRLRRRLDEVCLSLAQTTSIAPIGAVRLIRRSWTLRRPNSLAMARRVVSNSVRSNTGRSQYAKLRIFPIRLALFSGFQLR